MKQTQKFIIPEALIDRVTATKGTLEVVKEKLFTVENELNEAETAKELILCEHHKIIEAFEKALNDQTSARGTVELYLDCQLKYKEYLKAIEHYNEIHSAVQELKIREKRIVEKIRLYCEGKVTEFDAWGDEKVVIDGVLTGRI